ncbi:MAG: hypothetical protein EXR82_08390 [Gammaproteobacteria bacterium]|nr:hypothetical protein [Gammaproteobacteria bacterium]
MYRRHLILQSFAAIHRDSRDLLMRGVDAQVKSKGMSKRLGELEAAWTGKPAPETVELVPLLELMTRAGKRRG